MVNAARWAMRDRGAVGWGLGDLNPQATHIDVTINGKLSNIAELEKMPVYIH